MSGYTVEWLPEAEQDLTDAWTSAPDRRAVTDAQNVIDRLLARNPLGLGEELAEGLRKLTVEPLVAFYEVDASQRHVRVSNVAHTG